MRRLFPMLLLPLSIAFSLVSGACDGGSGRTIRDGATIFNPEPGVDLAYESPDLAGVDFAEPFMGAVYAHSSTELFEVDPQTLKVTRVAPFSFTNGGSEEITDIALDRDGQMYGISFGSVFQIDKSNAKCKRLAALPQQFNGLSFVPPDQIDQGGNDEILVGASSDGTLYQLAPATGKATRIGAYGGGYGSSGDVVAVTGLGAIATVSSGGFQFPPPNDQLARIDFRNGGKAEIIGDTGFQGIWGIAFWGDKVYGFTDGGDFITIDVKTGRGRKVKNQGIAWWGAGVTTIAPVTIQ